MKKLQNQINFIDTPTLSPIRIEPDGAFTILTSHLYFISDPTCNKCGGIRMRVYVKALQYQCSKFRIIINFGKIYKVICIWPIQNSKREIFYDLGCIESCSGYPV